MSSYGTFCTVFNCMDGRCQSLVGQWCRDNFGVDFPDTLTIAGANGVLCSDETEWSRALMMAKISTDKHGATRAVLVGHSGCAGFIASPEEHKEVIRKTVEKIKAENLYQEIVGLYMDVDQKTLEEVVRV